MSSVVINLVSRGEEQGPFVGPVLLVSIRLPGTVRSKIPKTGLPLWLRGAPSRSSAWGCHPQGTRQVDAPLGRWDLATEHPTYV